MTNEQALSKCFPMTILIREVEEDLNVAKLIVPGEWLKADYEGNTIIEQAIHEIDRKAHSGQWSDAVVFGMEKAIGILKNFQE